MVSINKLNVNPVVSLARMVVFVPETLENVADFARQIYFLAASQQREVLYLTFNQRAEDELTAARQLATLSALTRDQAVEASTCQIQAGDWNDALCQVVQPGDLVIWPEERLRAPASLEQKLGITQEILPEVYTPTASSPTPWYRPVLFWLSGLVILVGFSFLEFTLVGQTSGALRKALLVILITLELGAFYQWDRIFS